MSEYKGGESRKIKKKSSLSRRLRFTLDPFTITMIIIPVLLFTLFLVIPLGYVLISPALVAVQAGYSPISAVTSSDIIGTNLLVDPITVTTGQKIGLFPGMKYTLPSDGYILADGQRINLVKGTVIEWEDGTPYAVFPNGTRIELPQDLRSVTIPYRSPFTGEEAALITIHGIKFEGALLNSLIVAATVTAIAVILGLLVGFVFARYNFYGKTFFRILAIIPLLMVPFANAIVVRRLFAQDGPISYFINAVLGLPYLIDVTGIAGVVLTQVITFFPIVYLNVFSSMMLIDPTLEEQAENLGARGFKLFRTVTLPLSLPGLLSGAAIVFIFSLEDLGGPIVFQEHNLLSYKIFEKISNAIKGGASAEAGLLAIPDAAIYSAIILAIALTVFVSIKKYLSLRQYAMMTKGGRWTPRARMLGLKGHLIVYLLLLPFLLFAAAPQIGVLILGFSHRWVGPSPEGFPTVENFAKIATDPALYKGVINSLVYSFSAVLIIILLGFTAAYVVARVKLPGIGVLDVLATSPLAIPGIAIATGYFLMFSQPFLRGTPLYIYVNPAVALVISYAVRRSPFTTRAIYAGLLQTHPTYEEAAMNLGASKSRTLFTILLPLIGISVLSGALISFVYSMSETSTSITIGLANEDQRPLVAVMYDQFTKVEAYQIVGAMGVILIAIQLTSIVIITMVLKQRYAFIGV